MGNKVNPHGLRVGITKTHSSSWFVDKTMFSNYLDQDRLARKLIEEKFAQAFISKIEIQRDHKSVDIDLIVARPGIVIGRGGKAIESAKKELSFIYKAKVNVKIIEAKSPESDAQIVAYMVADQCLRRISPKQAIRRELEKMKEIRGVIGARIAVRGRINKVEMARTEKVQFGSIPLHTLKANIDYALYAVRVPSAGLHGIKVWIYKGEEVKA